MNEPSNNPGWTYNGLPRYNERVQKIQYPNKKKQAVKRMNQTIVKGTNYH